MIVGNPRVFAIESGITKAYERLGFRALGFFVIHVAGRIYGVREPDATLLACSLDEVERRLMRRGTHTAPFALEANAGSIADAVAEAYSSDPHEDYMGMSEDDFLNALYHRDFSYWQWAPDGDEAFDDCSHVLQFDVEERVRLVAFKFMESAYRHDPATLGEVWLAADEFYGILQHWRDAFLAEWMAAPQASEGDGD